MGFRSVTELIDMKEPAWPIVLSWLANAVNHYEIIQGDMDQGRNTLYRVQVTTRSPLGSVALETGGILFDHGWLRVLGSGCDKIVGNLCSWNGLEETTELAIPQAFIIAYDVVGGIFAMNRGAFNGPIGNIHYFAPDTLKWEDLKGGYSEFIQWTAYGNLAKFYQAFRWPDWKSEVGQLKGDQGIGIWPPLWTKDGGLVERRSRKSVPIQEIVALQWQVADSLK